MKSFFDNIHPLKRKNIFVFKLSGLSFRLKLKKKKSTNTVCVYVCAYISVCFICACYGFKCNGQSSDFSEMYFIYHKMK